MSCGKAQGFLARHGIKTHVTVDARKATLARKEALVLARKADVVYASKGKRSVRLELKGKSVRDEDLAELIIGPTGNLRAPAFFVGKALVVGFDEATYATLLR